MTWRKWHFLSAMQSAPAQQPEAVLWTVKCVMQHARPMAQWHVARKPHRVWMWHCKHSPAVLAAASLLFHHPHVASGRHSTHLPHRPSLNGHVVHQNMDHPSSSASPRVPIQHKANLNPLPPHLELQRPLRSVWRATVSQHGHVPPPPETAPSTPPSMMASPASSTSLTIPQWPMTQRRSSTSHPAAPGPLKVGLQVFQTLKQAMEEHHRTWQGHPGVVRPAPSSS